MPKQRISYVPLERMDAAMQEEMRHIYGFDRPLPVQFWLWLTKALHGDLGTSIATGRPVATEVANAVGNTLLTIWGMVIIMMLS